MWFAFGGSIGFFAGFLIASIFAVSSGISRFEEWTDWSVYSEPEPEPAQDSAEVAALKAKLETAQADVAFYYQMATERTV